MAGAIFQALLAASALKAVATFQQRIDGVLSGTYTVPSSAQMVVLAVSWKAGGAGDITSASISGHAATVVQVNNSSVGIVAALVSPGDPNTWSVTGPNVSASVISVFVYTVTGVTSVNSPSHGGATGANPTFTLNVPANSTVVAVVSSQLGTSVSWSNADVDGTVTASSWLLSAAHRDQVNANASYAVTATVTGAVGGAGSFAVFAP